MSEGAESIVGRRQFLANAITVVGGLVTAALGIPIIGYVLSPLITATSTAFHEVGPTSDFREGQTVLTIYPVEQKDGWVLKEARIPMYVRREGPAEFTVFSPKCPHLGCMVQWNDNVRQFFCPCHAAVFDADGGVVAGPPPRPLDHFETMVENERLYVGRLVKSTEG